MDNDRGLTFERHAQTVVQIVIAAILIWMGNSTVDLKIEVAAIKAQLAAAITVATAAAAAANMAAVAATAALEKAKR